MYGTGIPAFNASAQQAGAQINDALSAAQRPAVQPQQQAPVSSSGEQGALGAVTVPQQTPMQPAVQPPVPGRFPQAPRPGAFPMGPFAARMPQQNPAWQAMLQQYGLWMPQMFGGWRGPPGHGGRSPETNTTPLRFSPWGSWAQQAPGAVTETPAEVGPLSWLSGLR